MTGRLLPPGLFGLEDLQVGDRIETATRQITAAMIDGFADLTGDRFEIHMDAAAAARHGFAGRVAHGLLVLSVVDGLKNQCPAQFRAVASLNWEWRFSRPVLAGDTIRASLTLAALRPTRTPGRGVLTLDVSVLNQPGEPVQTGRNLLLVQT